MNNTERIADIFSIVSAYDKKHKLNTTDKKLPPELIDNIENKGVTVEQIDDLVREGYDIYKYRTQITIHGICSDDVGRGDGYKFVTVNKNKSIGVRWIGVDRTKKRRIISLLSTFGYYGIENSTELHPIMSNRFDTIHEAKAECAKYKAIAERVDMGLFYGSFDIYILQHPAGWYYAVFELFIDGIFEKNIAPFIESITGKNMSEIQKEIDRIEAEREKERAEWRKQWAEEKKKEAEKKQNIEAELLKSGYVKAKSNELPKDTIFVVISSLGNVVRYIMTARSAKECDEAGNIKWDARPNSTMKKYACSVFVKK